MINMDYKQYKKYDLPTNIKSIIENFSSEKISNKQLEERACKIWTEYHKIFQEKITNAYLSHVVQGVQDYIREESKKPFFMIELMPNNYTTGTSALNNVLKAEYESGRFFRIYFPRTSKYGNIDSKEIRLGIAHELGHLLYLFINNETNANKNDELFSSLFAIAIIANRTHYYAYESKKVIHSSFSDIVNTMSLLHNRKTAKRAISGTTNKKK